MTRRIAWTCMILAVTAVAAPHAAYPADEKPAEDKAADAPVEVPKLKFVEIDLKNKVVDVEGNICLTSGPIELIATVLAGKEHEAICTVKARPQHIHIALLMIGLKSGKPSEWRMDNDGKVHARDATGDRVHVSIVYEKDGQQIEKPVGHFVRHIETRTPMSGSVFVFAGSYIVKPEKGAPYYAADATGDVVTTVSFEDEMLAMPKAASKSNDSLKWEANTDALPELGTPILLRLCPAKEGETPAGEAVKPKQGDAAGQK